jgi:spore germination protein GerM
MMDGIMTGKLNALLRFAADKSRRRLFLLGVLGTFALIDFSNLELVRRTFVFYAAGDGMMTIEDRMLKRSPSRETDITRYVEEALLGPVSPDSLPLFPRETRLRSLLYRDDIVYVDMSEDAALPPLEGGEILANFRTLYNGIQRNFSFVKDVRFFIDGRAAYIEEFR